MKKPSILAAVFVAASLTASAQGPRRIALGDWPELRGPARDGVSRETGLVERWALNGANFLWRVPYGGRSAPVVMGNRVYVQNPSGRGEDLRERVMALDADTGRVVWQHLFNLYQSDVPPHRVAWASPAVDQATGNVYAFSGGAEAIGLDRDGKLLWSRSIGEEFAAFTTHGGRTMSPVIDGDLVIVSAAVSNWGAHAARAHRLIALDKRTGEVVYVANPGGRPYDTAYASPIIATINGQRLLIVGLGDGAVHAVKPQTGEKVWSYVASKRSINTGVVTVGNNVIVSHGDENLDTNALGLIASINGALTGDIKTTNWAVKGIEFGYSPPVTDGSRIYQIDNGSHLKAFDAASGKELWELELATAQKAPPVLADGKIYVGTDNGKFFIVRPGPTSGQILSAVELPVSTNSCCGSEGTPEQILGAAAVSRGRIYFVSSDAVYAIGPRQARSLTGFAADEPAVTSTGAPAHLQVSPTELVLAPGQTVTLRARLFDAQGRFLREAPAVWSLDGLRGAVTAGRFTVAPDQVDQAGVIKATVDGLTGEARARVARSIPWTETFDSYADGAAPPGWVNMTAGRLAVATVDGQKVLEKAPLDTLFKRIRAFIGPTTASNYTFEADVRAAERRRQLGDVGITAQRYSLILYGSSQRLKLESWEPETTRTVSVPFAWQANTWYRLKIRVQNEARVLLGGPAAAAADTAVRIQGKAWPVGQPEPAAWHIDKREPSGHRQGAPGFFIDAQFGAYIDNVRLTPNQ